MRYLDIICESIPTSPKFLAWFKGSKVVDKQGQPLRMFHGTTKEFEMPLQTFTHFGTADAANTRIYDRFYKIQNHKGDSREPTAIFFKNAKLFPVFLSIKNPYIYTDFRNNGYADILRKLIKDGIAHRMDVEELKATGLPGWGNANYLHKECSEFILEKLIPLGYDGLRYKNKWEDIGSYSWVVFNSDQVWHEFQ